MRLFFLGTAILGILQMSSAVPAVAAGIASYVETQTSSPVQVLSCSAGLQYVNSGYGTELFPLKYVPLTLRTTLNWPWRYSSVFNSQMHSGMRSTTDMEKVAAIFPGR